MKTMMISGCRPLLATAAVLALSTATLLAQPALAHEQKMAAATPSGHTHNHPAASGTAEAPLNIVRLPSDLPGPIGKRGPQRVKVNLETTEVTGQLADGTTYHYWTFNS
ncbi:MAG TPA: hypothetical protein VEZ24_12200, partial [Microvirga sp.]|nr:hypothetical protein [Microvirga sp.]